MKYLKIKMLFYTDSKTNMTNISKSSRYSYQADEGFAKTRTDTIREFLANVLIHSAKNNVWDTAFYSRINEPYLYAIAQKLAHKILAEAGVWWTHTGDLYRIYLPKGIAHIGRIKSHFIEYVEVQK